ncbi:MFS transporter [Streptomyces sp. NBC_01485]|uniref:MFS transporter n=1 Tax=Streptomyces sp. NBC_01485 TaxID=2903884 RepID=UPI002E3597D6|nr:MFS transporter [Streptomyces sp. NBC_01485]
MIAVAQLMVVLDATIVNVALPRVQTSLGFSTENLSWVINAYTLTYGGLLLLGGRIGDIFGRRRAFAVGVMVFGAASLLGGLAPSSGWLLFARALQGTGAAIVSPAVLALIATNFTEERERNRAFGVFAGVSGAGAAIGLLAGGLLTQYLDWRWVFFVNVPLAVALVLLAPLFLAESARRQGRFDVAGAITSAAGMTGLVYGFIRVSQHDWSDLWALASFAAGVVLLVSFVVIERTTANPIVPLRMFANRNRASIYVVALALTGALAGLFFFLTLYMQNVLGYSPVEAGLAFLPISLTVIVTVGVTSKLLARFGQKIPLVSGVLVNAAALSWLTRLDSQSTYAAGLLGPMLVFGIGTGMMFMPLTMLGVSDIDQADTGAASGVLNATQQVGGSLGLSILVTVFGSATRGESGSPADVLTSGVTTAFGVAAAFALGAFAVAVTVIRAPAVPITAVMPGAAGTAPDADVAVAKDAPGPR